MTNHDHSNGHAHDHTAGANARQLTIALALTGTFLIVEVIGGLVFNSLALLSDAAHMFTDAAALAIALLAIKIGQRPADEKRTFGYRRFEILAAAFNAVLLFVVAGYVLYEGIKRILDPEPVGSIGMLIVAAAGLVINLISMRILSSGKDRSLNVKGAYLEVWADMLGSLGVLVAAVVITVTDWRWVDPIVAIAIGLWVLPRTWILLRDTTHILLEGAPRGVALSDVRVAILSPANLWRSSLLLKKVLSISTRLLCLVATGCRSSSDRIRLTSTGICRVSRSRGSIHQRIPFLKAYTVFNVDQIEALPERYGEPEVIDINPDERIARIDAFFRHCGAEIRHGGGSAYYAPGPDHVQMPQFECFETADAYYSTLGHEMTHWTRHPSRLDRDFGRQRFGDSGYAREELVAELGAAFLCADLGLALEPREDHSAYIANWLHVLKDDVRFVVSAASHAQKAVDHLKALQPPP